MRVPLFGLALCGIAGLVAATPASSPFDRFVGSWNCASVAGSSGQMTFTRTRNGLVLRADWKNGGGHSNVDHTFTVNTDGTWMTTEMNAAKTATFNGSSPGFDGDTITFSGTQHVGDRAFAQLEKFRFTSADAFEHIWYGQSSDGQWQPDAYQECTKVSS